MILCGYYSETQNMDGFENSNDSNDRSKQLLKSLNSEDFGAASLNILRPILNSFWRAPLRS